MLGIWRKIHDSTLFKFVRNDKGSILPLFAVVIALLIGVGGAGVDFANSIRYKYKVQHALDAAALILARQMVTTKLSEDDIGIALQNAFKANIDGMDLGDLAISNFKFDVDPGTGLINVRSSVSVPTNFLRVGGIGPESLEVGVRSRVRYPIEDVEVALVLDVTGSMGPHMSSLKDSVTLLLDELMPNANKQTPYDPRTSRFRMSVVPYSQGVNLGQSYAHMVTDGDVKWPYCVTERVGDNKYLDTRFDWHPDREHSTFFGSGTTGCSRSSLLQPLTAQRDDIERTIRNLRAQGWTSGHTGIAWGWYTLSPKWAPAWLEGSDPKPYNAKVIKYAVLMTDGDFNTFYNQASWSYKECKSKRRQPYEMFDGKRLKIEFDTGQCKAGTQTYWYQNDPGNWANRNNFGDESAKRARQFCDNMKAEGIKVFGLYFGTNEKSPAAQVMRYCASSDDLFATAKNRQQLQEEFKEIANKILETTISG